MPSLESHKRWFDAFVDGFRHGDPEDLRNVQLKHEHSLQVLAIAERIAASAAPDSRLHRLCLVAALYHDCGRFPQYVTYRTFNDTESINHGELGARVLRGHPEALEGLDSEGRRLVLGTVFLHNRKSVPTMLPEPLRHMLRVVRDSDKLDIMRVMLEHFDPDKPKNPVATLRLIDDPDRYTPTILDAAMRRVTPDYGQMRWLNDFKLLLLAWSFDLSFAASREVFRERGYLEQLASVLPKRPEFEALLRLVQTYLNNGDGSR
ncbi:HD domain-containing protein [Desulfocurvibacter africanus]|uniref:HD domain-containing protein n=1 Tax=Desulfocurvibacter africanus TaxID=873 RepID=UPI002FD9C3D4